MTNYISGIIKWKFRKIFIKISIIFNIKVIIRIMRYLNDISLDADEIFKISKVIKIYRPANILVFGVGNDSTYWNNLNKNGNTIFLEDNEKWLNKISKINPNLKIYKIDYDSNIKNWKHILNKPNQLNLIIPQQISNLQFDIILVDAPSGFTNKSPGRMKSIFSAYQLANNSKNKVNIFVHDCDRIVERSYCDYYLKDSNLIDSINKLRHYRL